MTPTDPFLELKTLTDAVYAGKRSRWATEVLALLERHGIKRRQDDGQLVELTFSVAKSRHETLVVGLRYRKRAGDHSEDHFLFTPGEPIEKCYGKRVEKILPEYEGTHKAPPEGVSDAD